MAIIQTSKGFDPVPVSFDSLYGALASGLEARRADKRLGAQLDAQAAEGDKNRLQQFRVNDQLANFDRETEARKRYEGELDKVRLTLGARLVDPSSSAAAEEEARNFFLGQGYAPDSIPYLIRSLAANYRQYAAGVGVPPPAPGPDPTKKTDPAGRIGPGITKYDVDFVNKDDQQLNDRLPGAAGRPTRDLMLNNRIGETPADEVANPTPNPQKPPVVDAKAAIAAKAKARYAQLLAEMGGNVALATNRTQAEFPGVVFKAVGGYIPPEAGPTAVVANETGRGELIMNDEQIALSRYVPDLPAMLAQARSDVDRESIMGWARQMAQYGAQAPVQAQEQAPSPLDELRAQTDPRRYVSEAPGNGLAYIPSEQDAGRFQDMELMRQRAMLGREDSIAREQAAREAEYASNGNYNPWERAQAEVLAEGDRINRLRSQYDPGYAQYAMRPDGTYFPNATPAGTGVEAPRADGRPTIDEPAQLQAPARPGEKWPPEQVPKASLFPKDATGADVVDGRTKESFAKFREVASGLVDRAVQRIESTGRKIVDAAPPALEAKWSKAASDAEANLAAYTAGGSSKPLEKTFEDALQAIKGADLKRILNESNAQFQQFWRNAPPETMAALGQVEGGNMKNQRLLLKMELEARATEAALERAASAGSASATFSDFAYKAAADQIEAAKKASAYDMQVFLKKLKEDPVLLRSWNLMKGLYGGDYMDQVIQDPKQGLLGRVFAARSILDETDEPTLRFSDVAYQTRGSASTSGQSALPATTATFIDGASSNPRASDVRRN